MSEPLVIVGAGMASTRLVQEISSHALGRYSIVVIGDEPRPAYNRVLLSSLLAGEIDAAALDLAPRDWWTRHGVTNIYGSAVKSIDRETKSVTLANGVPLSYSKLVLATGSQAIRLPKPGMNLPGVITFRDIADVEHMRGEIAPDARVTVIGGGLLGIEAAYGLARTGRRVTLIHLMDRLMERQLDASAAAMLKRGIERKGVNVILNADTACVEGGDRAEAVRLTDGTIIPSDLVVCAIGIRPNVELARTSGLNCNRGVVVDDGLATSDANIFAIGECAEHRGGCYGLVAPAYEQAAVLARRLAGDRTSAYEGSTLSTNLKVSGVNVFSAGDFSDAVGREKIVYEDAAGGVYKKLVIEGERLVGAVLVGQTSDALWYLDLIREGSSVAALRDDLAFGRAFVQQMAA